ncbi:MAG: FtsW/RodA/SpoVE family cell cycle protein [Chloroflexota bacterium]
MTNLIQFRNRIIKSKPAQLMLLAGLFVIGNAFGLSISNAAKLKSWQVVYTYQQWIGVLIWGTAVLLLYWQIKKHIPQADKLLLPIITILSGWGMIMIWRLFPSFGLRQSLWILASAVIMITGLKIKNRLNLLRQFKYLWLIFGLGLTALTFIIGTNPLGIGPRLWLGGSVIYFQPSEPLKLLLVVFLAAYMADRQPFILKLMPLLFSTLIITGMAILLLLVQRDLGTASILVCIYTFVIYAATGEKRVLIISALILLFAGMVGFNLFEVIQVRVEAWLNPWIAPSGRSYQIVQSLIAIGAGGIFGRGLGMGSPAIVPVSHSDFIFSSIAEEFGLVGTLAVITLLAILTIRGLRISLLAKTRYHRYLAAGLTSYLAIQSIFIIGGTIRLLPLTGVTLPFISYGGSSLVTSFIAVLLLMLISNKGEKQSRFENETQPIFPLAWIFILGFILAGLVNGYWSVIQGPDLQTRTDNPRRAIADRFVPRGNIFDRDDNLLTETIGTTGELERIYLHPELSSVLGYTHPIYGQVGAEASLDPTLRGLAFQNPFNIWWQHILYGQPPPGLDVRLTIDLEQQNLAEELLDGTPGAAVLLDAKSGEILIMASSPSFNANQLAAEWESIIEDPTAPLVNRATLGSYQPGTILGPFLLARLGTSGLIPDTIEKLDMQIGEINLDCAESPTRQTWGAVVQAGCPAPIAELGLALGEEKLHQLFIDFGFYTAPNLRLPTTTQPPQSSVPTPATAAVGQADLRINPLQLSIAAAVLSNSGQIPAPQILYQVHTPENGWINISPLGTSQGIIPTQNATRTAFILADENLMYWEASAIAYNSPDKALSWYMAGTLPNTSLPPYVVVVLLEEDNPEKAIEIGQTLLVAFE